MFEKLKNEWRQFRDAKPGKRFLAYHDRTKSQRGAASFVRMGLGIVLAAAGVVMLVVPGPGILFIFFGLALLAARSAALSKVLDKAELWMRKAFRALKRAWQSLPWPVIAGLLMIVAGAAVGVGALVWRWLA